MKKVLIALDYDPTAQKVAEQGYSLAKKMGAEVVLLHVIADTTYYSGLEYSPIVGFMGFSAADTSHLLEPNGLKKATEHYLEKTRLHLGGERIQTLVREGDFADAILQTAKHLHADIIVMGSHSRRWLNEILMGSVTEKVLHRTSKPLFIIPIKKHN